MQGYLWKENRVTKITPATNKKHLDTGTALARHAGNNIQVTLLSRYRNTDLTDEQRQRWLKPLLRSINAIASGMRNTG